MATRERLDYGSPDGCEIGGPVRIGVASSDSVGFYGVAGAARRTFVASLHDTTAIASSTDFTAAHLAVLNEVQNTLRGLGIWATA